MPMHAGFLHSVASAPLTATTREDETTSSLDRARVRSGRAASAFEPQADARRRSTTWQAPGTCRCPSLAVALFAWRCREVDAAPAMEEDGGRWRGSSVSTM